jgi:chromosome partitioning protein
MSEREVEPVRQEASNPTDEKSMQPRLIAIANQKGGAGKSTLAVNLSAAWAGLGRRTLLIDVDPRYDSTSMLGVQPSRCDLTLYEVFTDKKVTLLEARIIDVIPGLDFVPSSDELGDVPLTLVGKIGREKQLAAKLKDQLDDYDFVLLDTPADLGLLTVNALFAVREVVVPVAMTDSNAYKGARQLLQTVDDVVEGGGDVAVTALVRNQADPRRRTYRTVNHELEAHLRGRVAQTQIPLRAELNNAGTEGKPLAVFAPEHPLVETFVELAREIERRGRRSTQQARAA